MFITLMEIEFFSLLKYSFGCIFCLIYGSCGYGKSLYCSTVYRRGIESVASHSLQNDDDDVMAFYYWYHAMQSFFNVIYALSTRIY